MKSRVLVVVACLAVLGAAGWWLLREDARATSRTPVDALRPPEALAPSAIQLPDPAASAPPAAATPVALEPAANGTPAAGRAPPANGAPSLRGRVVIASSGGDPGEEAPRDPVPGAHIEGQLKGKKRSQKLDLTCDADGRFEVALQPPDLAPKNGTLTVTHPQGFGRAQRTVTPEDLERFGGNLGDIELLAARPVHVLVRDAASSPVPGAIVVPDDDTGVRSDPTDAQGHAVLPAVLLDTPSVTGWAHRYFAGHASLPAPEVVIDEEHPIVVVLERCPSLEVVVTDASGAPQAELYAVLRGDQVLFADLDAGTSLPAHMPRFAPNPMLHEAGAAHSGATEWSSRYEAGELVVSGSVSFKLDKDGRASISGLLPEVPFTLSVQDETDGVAWGPEPLTLHPGEVREVRVTLAHAPIDLRVRVVDPEGKPLEGAYVEVVREGQMSSSAPHTNAQGLVTLSRIYTDTLTLSVDKPGFVTQRVEGVVVARGGKPYEVVLQPGVQVHVLVEDTYGRPVQAETVRARLDGKSVGISVPEEDVAAAAAAGAEASAAGLRPLRAKPAPDAPPEPPEVVDHSRWLLSDLPPAPLVIEAVVGGRVFAQPHDSRKPEASVTVPGVGALRVIFDFPLDEAFTHVLDVRAAGAAGDPDLAPVLGPWERSIREHTLPSLVPGDYAVVLYRWDQGKQIACSSPATVHVTEGTTVTLALAEP